MLIPMSCLRGQRCARLGGLPTLKQPICRSKACCSVAPPPATSPGRPFPDPGRRLECWERASWKPPLPREVKCGIADAEAGYNGGMAGFAPHDTLTAPIEHDRRAFTTAELIQTSHCCAKAEAAQASFEPIKRYRGISRGSGTDGR